MTDKAFHLITRPGLSDIFIAPTSQGHVKVIFNYTLFQMK